MLTFEQSCKKLGETCQAHGTTRSTTKSVLPYTLPFLTCGVISGRNEGLPDKEIADGFGTSVPTVFGKKSAEKEIGGVQIVTSGEQSFVWSAIVAFAEANGLEIPPANKSDKKRGRKKTSLSDVLKAVSMDDYADVFADEDEDDEQE